jgi:DNA-binding response OmpR family regulator
MQTINVLIVDDDAAVQNVVGETLREAGFVSQVASSAEQAAALLNKNEYRVLIVDISFGLNRVEGWSVARRARAFDASLPVIYITGGSGNDWAVHAVPNSILLKKPFGPAQLLSAISQLVHLDYAEQAKPNVAQPDVALRAYQLWEAAGRPQGRDEEFYFQAEEELRQPPRGSPSANCSL